MAEDPPCSDNLHSIIYVVVPKETRHGETLVKIFYSYLHIAAKLYDLLAGS